MFCCERKMAWNGGQYFAPPPPPCWTNFTYGTPPNPSANSNVWFPPYQYPFSPTHSIPPPLPNFYDAGWSTAPPTNWHEPTSFRGQSRGGRWHKKARGGTNAQRISPHQGVESSSTQEAGDFNCCGKTYKTLSAYQSHLCTHKKCDVCEYSGSGKALKDHALLAHFIPDELKFDSPEEIQKWKDARKRNYPTATNVAKKRKLASEKRETGAVAETPLYRYINHIVNNDRGSRGRGRGSKWHIAQRGGRHWRGRPKGRACSQGYRDNADAATDSHDEDVKALTPLSPAACDMAAPWDCTVGESGATANQPLDAQNLCQLPQDIQGISQCSGDRQVVSQPSEGSGGPIGSQNMALKQSHEQGALSSAGRRKNGHLRPKRQDKSCDRLRKPTLLEKLLATEIRKEQNAILQCIRHIVKKDFLRPVKQDVKSD